MFDDGKVAGFPIFPRPANVHCIHTCRDRPSSLAASCDRKAECVIASVPPLPPPPPLSSGALVLALSNKDTDRFFPSGFPTDALSDLGIPLHLERPNRALSPEQWAARLRELNATVLVSAWSTPSLYFFETEPEICPLAYVCHLAGSVRQLIPAALIERGLLVTNWGPLVAPQVAEHALLLILAGLRDLPSWPAGLSADAWQRGLNTRMLCGKRVGIYGFGAIARELAAFLRPFNVGLQAWSHGVSDNLIREYDAVPASSLEALFASSDILVVCEALTPATQRSVSRQLLSRLPDQALFVNIARGGLVDHSALEAEVLSGRLRVALDVHDIEPIPADSPLRHAPGAVLSPHIAGPTHDAYPRIGQFAVQNLRRYFAGQRPDAVITAEAYARST